MVIRIPAKDDALANHCKKKCILVRPGTEAVKLAIPIGAWAVKQGFRVARDLLFEAKDESKPRRKVVKNRDEESD